MTMKKTQQTLSTTLEKTEQSLNGLETALENNVGAHPVRDAGDEEKGLPEGWIGAPIGEVAGIYNGRAFKQTEWAKTGLPIIRIQNLNKPTAMFNYFKGELDQRHLVHNGDLLFAWSGTPGTSFGAHEWKGGDAALNQHIFKIELNENCTSKIYFRYAMNHKLQEMIGKANGGVGLRHITKKTFETTLVSYPPLAEQTVIAQTLDTLLAQVDNIKTRLDAIPNILKTFRQSVLAAAVSGKLTEAWRGENECVITERDILDKRFVNWCDERLAEFSLKGKKQKNELWKNKYTQPELVENDKIWPIPEKWCWSTIDAIAKVTKLAGFEFTKHVNYTEDGDLPVIKAENVGVNGYRHKFYSYVKSEDVETLTRSELTGREILIVFVGAGVGQVGISPDDRKYFLGPNVAVVKQASNLYSPEYLELYLRSLSGKEILLSFSKGGAQPSLSMGQIRKTSIPIPPVSEQTEIVRRVEELFAFAIKSNNK